MPIVIIGIKSIKINLIKYHFLIAPIRVREVVLKSQIASTKLQINHKFQYSMTKTFEILNFGHWDLFVICYLVLEIFLRHFADIRRL
jgi:hypothetical protein